jgi:hypothetical protein
MTLVIMGWGGFGEGLAPLAGLVKMEGLLWGACMLRLL